MSETLSALPAFDLELGALLNFTAEDLAANVAGQLSEPQAARLLAQARADLRNRVLMGIFFVAIGVVFGIAVHDPLNIILFVLLIASLVWLTVRGWRDCRADLAAGTVEHVEGRIGQPNRRGFNGLFLMASEVVIGGQRCQLAVNTQRKLDLAQGYRAYYTPHTGSVVALEAIDLPAADEEAPAVDDSEMDEGDPVAVDRPEAD